MQDDLISRSVLLQDVIDRLEKRKDYLLKEFLLAEKDLSVKKNADARINEIDWIIGVIETVMDEK